jgi:hypothetical protein
MRAVAAAKVERETAQQALERAKERVREARSDAKVQARELARKELENQRLQRRAARADAETTRKRAAEVGEVLRLAAHARQAADVRQGKSVSDEERAAAVAAKLASAERDVALVRQVEVFGAYRAARAAVAEREREEAAFAVARVKAAELREAAAALRAKIAPGFPAMAAIAALRELWTERQTAEARLGGGLTVMVRRKQPIEITGEADEVALVEKAGRGAVSVAAKQMLRLDLGDVAELEITAGEEVARQAATALRERWHREAEPVFAAHGVATLAALEARRREADDLEREAAQLDRDAAAQDERAARPSTSEDAQAAQARCDELEEELAGAYEFARLGERWQAALKLWRDKSGTSRDEAVAALEQARALAKQGQADLERLRTEADRLEAETVRRRAELPDDWTTVVATCDRTLIEIDAALADLDRDARLSAAETTTAIGGRCPARCDDALRGAGQAPRRAGWRVAARARRGRRGDEQARERACTRA